MKRSAAAMVIVVLFSSSVKAQDLDQCAAILNVPPSETVVSFNAESQADRVFSQICGQTLSDYSQATAFAGRAGISIPLLDGLFSFSAGAKSNATTFRSEFRQQCDTRFSSSFQERQSSRRREAYSDAIYRGWVSCVDRIASGKSMFVFAAPQTSDLSRYVINFRYNVPTPRPIRIESILPSDLVCAYANGDPVTREREINRTSFAIECRKPSEATYYATFETSEGTAQNVQLLGRQPRSPTDDLRTEVAPYLVPQGAIIPFESRQCPSGWSEYLQAQNRFVMGTPPDQNRSAAAEAPGSTGGAATATLDVPNLPAHSHLTELGTDPGSAEGFFGSGGQRRNIIFGDSRGTAWASRTESVGSGRPFGIIPPFVRLLYCRKD